MKSGWISSAGSFVSQFEENFSKYLEVDTQLQPQAALPLELALKTLKIGLGDEVILPNLSFAASINSIINVGAKPVVVDVNPKTWTIDCN